MTNAVDIICESCGARMRLSEALLSQIAGRTGRITCKRCEKKVGLDASGEALAVTYGGRLVSQDTSEDEAEPISASDPHLSEFPPGKKVNIPPPVSEELKARRRLRAMAAKHGTASALKTEAAAPAPEPQLERGSLSPHTLANEEEEEGLVPLGRAAKSTPYVSERDSTFESLYSTKQKASESPESVRVLPPMTGGAPLASVPSSEVQAVRVPPARRGAWVPWAIAAAALFALGISLSLQISGQDVLSDLLHDDKKSVEPSAASLPVEPSSAASPAAPFEEAAAEPTEPAPEEELEPKPSEPENTAAAPPTVAASPAVAVQRPAARSEEPSRERPAQEAIEKPAEKAPSEPAEEEEEALAPFSTAAASAALRQVTAQASGCRGADDPSGMAKVQVTFAPSGRVTSAVVSGPPYAGTTVGGCIASRFRKATVPPFAGDLVTVSKTVTIQ